ncbi:hypothetical protein H6P81_005720 [Aristolochia fimbriata]|uniref:Bulb-type lectin domain-containing protein n=1 Tax=Aristolochia fimbriata TaxID=158543 RepID=A0AAV7EY21_ARIFI|nr:hypothetical protein H6P81_005720 [Aristolochia fimbriata]
MFAAFHTRCVIRSSSFNGAASRIFAEVKPCRSRALTVAGGRSLLRRFRCPVEMSSCVDLALPLRSTTFIAWAISPVSCGWIFEGRLPFTSQVPKHSNIRYILLGPVAARDTITPERGLKDGETLVSGGGRFALGFFSPGRGGSGRSNNNRYVGIWYTSVSLKPVPIVWVANRDTPIKDSSSSGSSSMISIQNGSLVIIDGGANTIIWSTPTFQSLNSSAIITDRGNLQLLSETAGATTLLWQSFDHAGSVHLPFMRLGIDVHSNHSRFLRSWKSPWDPSVGNFSLGISPIKPYQVFICSNSGTIYWRSGPWNSRSFLGLTTMELRYFKVLSTIVDEGGSAYFAYAPFNDSMYNTSVFSLNSSGNIEQLEWSEEKKEWFTYWAAPINPCDFYGRCGPWGFCNTSSTSRQCSCLSGFQPRFREDWKRGNWTGGCVKMNPLSCATTNASTCTSSTAMVKKNKKGNDVFVKMESVKPPDSIAWLSFDMRGRVLEELLLCGLRPR